MTFIFGIIISAVVFFFFDDIQLIADTTTIGLASLPKIDGLSCFPNPATEQIRITSDNGSIDVIVVYDVLGNVLQTKKTTNTKTVSLELLQLNRGVYFMRINANSTQVTKKIIIE